MRRRLRRAWLRWRYRTAVWQDGSCTRCRHVWSVHGMGGPTYLPCACCEGG